MLAPYDIRLPVTVTKHKNGLFEVKQKEKAVLMADRLYLRCVMFYASPSKHYITGILCKPSDISDDIGPDEYNDYGCIYYNGENYVEKTTGLQVSTCTWCDLDCNSEDDIMAIWDQKTPQENQ